MNKRQSPQVESQKLLIIFQELFNFINPYLTNYEAFHKKLAKQVKVKIENNIQYDFDNQLDTRIKKLLKKHQITGHIFSEESGFFVNGKGGYRVAYDPLCNSSLASKSFLEAAVGISIFTDDYQLITSGILDYQTGVVGLVEKGKTNFYQIQTKRPIKFKKSGTQKLEDAWVVFTLESQRELKGLKVLPVAAAKARHLIISSGHIYWLRLAMGVVDVYADPIGGEHLYEMFAAAVAQGAGCIVTNKEGELFNPGEYLQRFEQDHLFRYYPVAAANQKLHQLVLGSLGKSL